MIPAIKQYLLEHWSELKLGEKPDDLIFVKYPDRGIRSGEVGVISCRVERVKGPSQEPVMIVRFPRYANSGPAKGQIKAEFDNLNWLRSKAGEVAAIPRPIALVPLAGSLFSAAGFLAGEPLGRRMLAGDLVETFQAGFRLTFAWLEKLRGSLGSGKTATCSELASGQLADFRGNFSSVFPEIERYFSQLTAAAAARPEQLKLTVQHGDLHAENVLVKAGEVCGVIDWEDFSAAGVPCFDEYHFVFTYAEGLLRYFAERKNIAMVRRLAGLAWYANEREEVFLPLYLVRSINLAAAPGKQAEQALKKLIYLLQMGPRSLRETLLYLALSILAETVNRYSDDPALKQECQRAMAEIKTELAGFKARPA